MIWTVSWELLARLLIAVSMAVISIGYFVSDYHPYINQTGYLLLMVLGIFLYWINGWPSKKFPLFRLVSFVVFFYVYFRFAVLIVQPLWLFGAGRATYNSMETILILFILGSLACYLGIAAASILLPSPERNLNPPRVASSVFKTLVTACVFSCLLILFNELVLGFAGSSGSSEHLGFFRRYFSRLFDPVIILVLLLVAYQLMPTKSALEKQLYKFTLITFAVILTFTGSRAAIYEAFILYLASVSVLKKSFTISLSTKQALGLLILILLMPVTFHLATGLRTFRYQFDEGRFYLSDTQVAIFEQISRRLSLVESTLFPVCQEELGLNNISSMVNPTTTLNNSINRLVPGKPFGRLIYTEFAWCFLIRKNGCFAYQYVDREDFVGYEWGMWAISHQLFGFGGGLLFIFLFSFGITLFTQYMQRRNTFTGLSAYALGGYALQFWVKNLGIDNWMDRFGHSYFLFFLYCFLLDWIAGNRWVQKGQSRAVTTEMAW